MKKRRLLYMCGWMMAMAYPGNAQRIYAPASVLANGNWFKIGVTAPGIYKIDIPFLNSLGVNTSSLSSAAIRLYGNGGAMLPEANNILHADDLIENAIQVADGGDGVLDGSDYVLFYANGPHEWVKDSVNQRFFHRKNIYSDKAFYFLTIGGAGKRITNAPLLTSPVVTVTGFSERYFHELDTVNFLGSGREWYGEEMSALPGRSLTRSFTVSLPNIQGGTAMHLQVSCAARSVNAGSRFDIRINNQPAGQLLVPATGSGQYDLFAREAASQIVVPGAQPSNNISFTYVPGGVNAQGWLNWFELFARRSISLGGINRLLFRDWLSTGNSRAEFVVSNAGSNTQVWEVTNPLNPRKMQGSLTGSEFRFVNDALVLREYVAFNPQDFLIPSSEGVVAAQNLHASSPADFIIVSFHSLLPHANAIAALHRQRNNLRTIVVSTDQVFNEFSGGSPDPAAIRDFVKMYWDKYGTTAGRPKYLLLFGDASFDYQNRLVNNTNLVPAWQTGISLDPLGSYTSDDFFGFLDDQEDINSAVVSNLLDIGIGRVPAKNPEEAKNYVDKLVIYLAPQSLGPWRNNLTFVADDEDGNLHLQDAEIITTTAAAASVFNQQKIYLDAYVQETSAGGSRYPLANQASNNQIYNGTLIWNYNGHGGPRRLAEETVLDQEIVNNWNNPGRLPLFITATCDFAPYDNPTVASLGENILLRPQTGAIALMTTTRPVFAFSNRGMNNNYLQFALQPDASGRYKTLGESVRQAKNYTYQTSGDIVNNRKFTLLGDPALTLGFPALKAVATKVNGLPVNQADTLSATEKVNIEGEITDWQGNLLTSFNGTVYPSVFEKPQTITTLANDPGSQQAAFQSQTITLFRGKARVTGGKFSFTFRVPRDINYQFGNGKLSLYAEDGNQDASGYFTNFIIGGAGSGNISDNTGPDIGLFLNDELFVHGGITNQNPVLIVKLADSAGINTVGTGIGHDIVATLDNDNNRYFILNDFFQAELNSYQQGTIRFQLPELEPGYHTLKVKAWDVLNNSGESVLEFTVVKNEELELSHVLNYPNPFTTKTSFWFEHNRPGQPLQVKIQIMTVTGRVVKTITRMMTIEGNRSESIDWDGRDDYGNRLGRGVYLYRLQVVSPDGKRKEKIEKMVLL
ncbi:MAG: type IX secretion system sortase PorU [Bacteroidetes bacterium]|nr:type IX secretion system sortase PorU [Bacteroidota bacterium]